MGTEATLRTRFSLSVVRSLSQFFSKLITNLYARHSKRTKNVQIKINLWPSEAHTQVTYTDTGCQWRRSLLRIWGSMPHQNEGLN